MAQSVENRPIPRPLATPNEVAAYRRVTTAVLAQERYRGTGPRFIKTSKKVYYDWDDVMEWVKANTLQRTDDPRGVA